MATNIGKRAVLVPLKQHEQLKYMADLHRRNYGAEMQFIIEETYRRLRAQDQPKSLKAGYPSLQASPPHTGARIETGAKGG